MTGKPFPAALGVLILGLGTASGVLGQAREPNRPSRIRVGPVLEYFSRTITSEDDAAMTKLKVGFSGLRIEGRIVERFGLGIFAGYGLSNPNGLVFRDLPFSIDYEAGNLGGLVVGGDVDASFLRAKKIEILGRAAFVLYLGKKKQVEVTDLVLPGGVEARETWMRVQAGPVVRFMSSEDFSPIVSIFYSRLWGTTTVNETIFDLTGTQEKKISGSGSLGGSFGFIFSPSTFFSLEVSANALPHKKTPGGSDFDYGASLAGVFSF